MTAANNNFMITLLVTTCSSASLMTVYRTFVINILLHPHSFGWVMSLSLNNALNSFTAT